MTPIPANECLKIAKKYGYDQVIIFARKVGQDPSVHGEHLTTGGIDKIHCDVAARIGNFLKYSVFGWEKDKVVNHES